MMRRLNAMLEGRLYEWSMAIASLGLALEIYIWPDTIRQSAFHLLDEVMGSTTLCWLMAICGILRMTILGFNGCAWIAGRFIRAGCAFTSAVVWAQFAYALYIMVEKHSGVPSPGIPFWGIFTLSEIYVVYRSMIDVRRTTWRGE